MPPVINEDRCVPCHVCIEVCPEDVFYGSNAGELPAITYPDECYHCAACVIDCPTEAITLYIPLAMRL
jgi:adenylylsulfate reductase subunit B